MSSAALKDAPVEGADATTTDDAAVTTTSTTTEDATTDAPETGDVESRARRMGWRPKEDFNGDPGKFVDAAEFVRRGEESLPMLRERIRKADRIAAEQDRKLDEGNKLLRDLVASQKAREAKAVEAAIKDLKAQRREASAAGDTDRVEALSTEIEQTQAAAAKPETTTRTAEEDRRAAEPPAEVLEWAEANPWFKADPVMNAVAVATYGKLLESAATKGLSETEKLAKVRAEVVRRFPEQFANTRRTETQVVESGGGGGRRTNGKTWNDIPAADRDIGARLIKSGAVKDQAAYARDYFN